MFLSKNLLISFFPQFEKLKNDEFEKYFNSIGVEVENIFYFEQTPNLIVAKIIETKPHPKSNKFTLCKVLANKKEYDVVCGSPNVENNSIVIFALPGTKMLDGRVILEKEILGIKSNGMICGYDELTKRSDYLSEEIKNKIVVLDSNAKINDKNPLKYIGFDDVIFDLSVPSNRPDLNSIMGIAYDLFPFLNLKFENLNFDFKTINKSLIKIENKANVNFFSILKINIKNIKNSSWKIKSYLMNSGIKLSDPLSDLCNLISLLTGNVIKCFSSDLNKNLISIENTNKPFSFNFENNKYQVYENNILYKINENLISVNGTNFFDLKSNNDIKNACIFNINLITLKSLNNSQVFKKSRIEYAKKVSIYFSMKAIEITLNLFLSANIEVSSLNFISKKPKITLIDFNYSKIISLLGISIPLAKIKNILTNIGFKFIKNKMVPPIHRSDIFTTNDVVEEILKILNINDSDPIPINSTSLEIVNNNAYKTNYFIKNFFINKGFFILRTYNLTSIELNKNFNIFNSKFDYLISNPISSDKEVLRNNLVEKHLAVLFENNSYKNEIYPSFEIQKIYINKKCETHICGIVPENIFENKIANSLIENNIFLIKSLLIDLFRYFSINLEFEKNISLNLNFLNKNNLLTIKKNDQVIGFIGQISSIYLNKNDFKKNVFFFEINIDDCLNVKSNDSFKIKSIDNKHLIIRDLSIIVKENDFEKLNKIIVGNNSIVSYNINNIYKMNDSESSYNISFVFQNNNKQLTNEEINLLFNNLISLLNENDFEIRKNSV